MKEKKLKHGAINEVATAFRVSGLTVSRIWHAAQTQYREGKICADISSKKKERCRRKHKDYSKNLAQIKNARLNRRGTLRSLSFAISIPNNFTTLQAFMELIMLAGGRSCYKIPHLSKEKLRREGGLLEEYVCSKEAYNKAKSNFE